MDKTPEQLGLPALRAHLAAHPEKAVGTDPRAVARLVSGLRTEVEGPSGQRAATDMPKGLGGGASAPSPGWYLRAGVASCTATVIALRAAELRVPLDLLEVAVESLSDNGGMAGPGDEVPAGPLSATLTVSIRGAGPATDAARARLEDIVRWGIAHSPMADALTRAVPMQVSVSTG